MESTPRYPSPSNPVDVTIVDVARTTTAFGRCSIKWRRQPRKPEDIAHPIRAIYAKHPNITVRLGTVTAVDLDARQVLLDDGASLDYHYLVVRDPGSSTNDFGIQGVREHAFPLKELLDAVMLRNRIIAAFEVRRCSP